MKSITFDECGYVAGGDEAIKGGVYGYIIAQAFDWTLGRMVNYYNAPKDPEPGAVDSLGNPTGYRAETLTYTDTGYSCAP